MSVPLSILDPPHRYRIHRRKSFDASDTLALPRVSSHTRPGGVGVGRPLTGPGAVPRPHSEAELREDEHPNLWSPGGRLFPGEVGPPPPLPGVQEKCARMLV